MPDLLSGAISVSFVGFFLGPIYPIVMNHAGAILPPELISGGVGWIASFGGAGAAVFPFIAGAIASRTSLTSLQPLCVPIAPVMSRSRPLTSRPSRRLIAMMGLLLIIWAFVPRIRVDSK